MDRIKDTILKELSEPFLSISEEEVNTLINAILSAKRIFTYACGREGLMLKAFAMRLHHLGFKVHVVGDVTTPAIGPNDLLIAVCGPGYVSTVITIADIAKMAGANVIGITANPKGEISKYCNSIVNIPAQTMVVKAEEVKSIQPMGAVFEQAQLLLEEYIVVKLVDKLKVSESDMRSRHANLE